MPSQRRRPCPPGSEPSSAPTTPGSGPARRSAARTCCSPPRSPSSGWSRSSSCAASAPSTTSPPPGRVQSLAVLTGAALLVGRRRWPLAVAALAATHMLVVGVTMPEVMGQFTLQLVYFVAILSGVSWARDRRLMIGVIGAIVLAMFVLARAAVRRRRRRSRTCVDDSRGTARDGLFAPIPAAVALTLLINAVYFGGAVLGGQASWRNARQKALARRAGGAPSAPRATPCAAAPSSTSGCASPASCTTSSATTCRSSASRRRRRAGSSTATPRPRRAPSVDIERSSREAVTQMRGLLGTLRDLGRGGGRARRPRPRARRRRPARARRPSARAAGLATELDVVESSPGAAQQLPAPLGLSLYRIAQEALANTARHSTARRGAHRAARGRTARPSPLRRGRGARRRPARAGHVRHRAWASSACASARPAWRRRSRSGRASTGGYRVRVRMPLPRTTVPEPTRRRACSSSTTSASCARASRMILSVEHDLEVVGRGRRRRRGRRAGPRAATRRRAHGRADAGHGRHRGDPRASSPTTSARVSSSPPSTATTTSSTASRAGASGFLLKNAEPEQLVDAVRAVGHGHALLAPEVTRRVIARMTGTRRATTTGCRPGHRGGRRLRGPAVDARLGELERLTDREREVLVLVGRGPVERRDRRPPLPRRGDRQDPRVERASPSCTCATASRPSCSPTRRGSSSRRRAEDPSCGLIPRPRTARA